MKMERTQGHGGEVSDANQLCRGGGGEVSDANQLSGGGGGALKKRKASSSSFFPPFVFLGRVPRYNRDCRGWLEAMFRAHPNNINWLFKKILTDTDTKGHHHRLLLPKKDVHKTLLPKLSTEEEEKVYRQGGDGLMVPTLDEKGRAWTLQFKYWGSNRAFVMIGDWMDIVRSNRMMPETHEVQLLSFREGATNKLCLVVIGRRRGEEEEKAGEEEGRGGDLGVIRKLAA